MTNIGVKAALDLLQGTVTFHEGFKADGQQKGAGDALQRA